MKTPYLWGWLTSLCFLLLAMIPTYAYVRLIPLGIGLLIGAWCGLSCLKRKRPGLARSIGAVLTAVVLIGGCLGTVTGGAIIAAGCREPEPGLPYIVVLGAKVQNGGPSETLKERIDAAYGYLTENPDTVAVVSGGQGSDEPISEAACMYGLLVDMGIEPERIWIEDRATSTWENLKFSLDIIESRTRLRPKRIGVVSSEFHLYRTARQFWDRDLEILGIPARTTEPVRYVHYFIREIAGVWHYLILGGGYT